MRVSVTLVGGPLDGEQVQVREDEKAMYVRQVENPSEDFTIEDDDLAGEGIVLLYEGNTKDGYLTFTGHRPIEYDAP